MRGGRSVTRLTRRAPPVEEYATQRDTGKERLERRAAPAATALRSVAPVGIVAHRRRDPARCRYRRHLDVVGRPTVSVFVVTCTEWAFAVQMGSIMNHALAHQAAFCSFSVSSPYRTLY